jgi:ABC-type branched-subunit amino acid transport system substrate-binding protein
MTISRRTLLKGTAAGLALSLPALRPSYAANEGVSDTEIKIGAFMPLQGGLAAGAAQYRDGAASYFQWVNDQGGINGRKVNWIAQNDSYNPQQAVAVSRELVDREGVLAVVSTLGTATNMAALPYLKRRGIPLIAPLATDPALNTPKDRIVFPLSPSGSTHGTAMAKFVAENLKARKLAVFYQDDQFGKDILEGVKTYAKQNGLEIVATASYVPSDIDVSPQAQQLRQANPDAVINSAIPKQGALMLIEAEKMGWKTNVIATQQLGDDVAKRLAGSAINGLYLELYSAVTAMKTPAVEQAISILQKYAPKTPAGYWAFMGMAGAKAFAEGARAAGKNLTRESLMNGLESLKVLKTGLVPPLDYSAGHHSGPTELGYGQWQDGEVKLVRNWQE